MKRTARQQAFYASRRRRRERDRILRFVRELGIELEPWQVDMLRWLDLHRENCRRVVFVMPRCPGRRTLERVAEARP